MWQTLAYYDTANITDLKSVIVQAQESGGGGGIRCKFLILGDLSLVQLRLRRNWKIPTRKFAETFVDGSLEKRRPRKRRKFREKSRRRKSGANRQRR
jgi:hypothetical protein